jgi:hypothetical protein
VFNEVADCRWDLPRRAPWRITGVASVEIRLSQCGEIPGGRWRRLAHFADALRDFCSRVSAAHAPNSFDDSWARPIGLFGTGENLTHLTECLKYIFHLQC